MADILRQPSPQPSRASHSVRGHPASDVFSRQFSTALAQRLQQFVLAHAGAPGQVAFTGQAQQLCLGHGLQPLAWPGYALAGRHRPTRRRFAGRLFSGSAGGAPGTAFLAAARLLVHRGPGAGFGFLGRYALGLVAVLDVRGLAPLLARGMAASPGSSWRGTAPRRLPRRSRGLGVGSPRRMSGSNLTKRAASHFQGYSLGLKNPELIRPAQPRNVRGWRCHPGWLA
jgi:hypothetical protein